MNLILAKVSFLESVSVVHRIQLSLSDKILSIHREMSQMNVEQNECHFDTASGLHQPQTVYSSNNTLPKTNSCDPYLPNPTYPITVQQCEQFIKHREHTYMWMIHVRRLFFP